MSPVWSPATNQAMSIVECGPFTSSVSSLINKTLDYKMFIKLFKSPHVSAHLFQTNTITFTGDFSGEMLKKEYPNSIQTFLKLFQNCPSQAWTKLLSCLLQELHSSTEATTLGLQGAAVVE